MMQKKNSAIKFEPSNLFSNPIEALRLDSNPLPYHAGFEPFTLLCIKKLLGWIRTQSTPNNVEDLKLEPGEP
jgi:hypothetical protein